MACKTSEPNLTVGYGRDHLHEWPNDCRTECEAHLIREKELQWLRPSNDLRKFMIALKHKFSIWLIVSILKLIFPLNIKNAIISMMNTRKSLRDFFQSNLIFGHVHMLLKMNSKLSMKKLILYWQKFPKKWRDLCLTHQLVRVTCILKMKCFLENVNIAVGCMNWNWRYGDNLRKILLSYLYRKSQKENGIC